MHCSELNDTKNVYRIVLVRRSSFFDVSVYVWDFIECQFDIDGVKHVHIGVKSWFAIIWHHKWPNLFAKVQCNWIFVGQSNFEQKLQSGISFDGRHFAFATNSKCHCVWQFNEHVGWTLTNVRQLVQLKLAASLRSWDDLFVNIWQPNVIYHLPPV